MSRWYLAGLDLDLDKENRSGLDLDLELDKETRSGLDLDLDKNSYRDRIPGRSQTSATLT